jgi:hypothetical protein
MISEDRLVDGVFIFCTSCTNILLARPWNAVRRVWTAPEAKGALDTFVKETLFHFAGPLNAFFRLQTTITIQSTDSGRRPGS